MPPVERQEELGRHVTVAAQHRRLRAAALLLHELAQRKPRVRQVARRNFEAGDIAARVSRSAGE